MQLLRSVGAGLCVLAIWTGAVFAQDPEKELREVDRAFAAHSKEHGPRAAFLEYMAEDGIILRAAAAPLVGRAAYAKATEDGASGATLDWAPEHAVVSDDGTLGYTWGYYVYAAPGKDGVRQETRGKYVSVWRRQADGSWKFIADIGNIDPSGKAGKTGE